MTDRGFTVPAEGAGLDEDQSELDKVDFDILAAGLRGTGVASGGEVTAVGGSMDVAVAASVGSVEGVAFTNAGDASLTISAADPLLSRYDLITVEQDGTLTVVEGTPAAKHPRFPDDTLPTPFPAVLASVRVGANVTEIVQANSVPKRVLISGGGGGALPLTSFYYLPGGLSIGSGSVGQFDWDTLVGPEVLDRTDPANPVMIADGTYAISMWIDSDAYPVDPTTPGYVEFSIAYPAAGPVYAFATQVPANPGFFGGADATISVTRFIPAGATLAIKARHGSSSAVDFNLQGVHVQPIVAAGGGGFAIGSSVLRANFAEIDTLPAGSQDVSWTLHEPVTGSDLEIDGGDTTRINFLTSSWYDVAAYGEVDVDGGETLGQWYQVINLNGVKRWIEGEAHTAGGADASIQNRIRTLDYFTAGDYIQIGWEVTPTGGGTYSIFSSSAIYQPDLVIVRVS